MYGRVSEVAFVLFFFLCLCLCLRSFLLLLRFFRGCFKKNRAARAQATMVMAHRSEAAWARSMWSFDEPPGHPRSLGSFLASEAPRRWAQGTELLDRLQEVTPPRS